MCSTTCRRSPPTCSRAAAGTPNWPHPCGSRTDMDTAPVRSYLLDLQARIVAALQAADGKAFASDGWTRPAGGRLEGDGLTQLVEEGNLLERGGCNFSHVKGQAMPPSATQHRPELAGAPFEALGVSLVFHPRNPYVPTVH